MQAVFLILVLFGMYLSLHCARHFREAGPNH
jgi:hypothetical protein